MQKKHQIIIDAINKVEGVFTNSEKKILIEFIAISIDNQVTVTTKLLKNLTSLSSTAIYTAINSLQLKGYIKKMTIKKHSYEIDTDNLQCIVDLSNAQLRSE